MRITPFEGSLAARMPTLLNVEDAADYLSLSSSFLNKARLTGTGPRFSKLGRRVLYRVEALDAWVAERERGSTSEAALP